LKTFNREILYFDLTGYLKREISRQPDKLGFFILYSLIFLLLILYIYTLMPASIFNFGDDYSIYNYRPVLMFGSGTIGHNNPFSSMPLDTLGGHAFMQSFFLLIFDYKYFNGFDAILCFFLGIFMVLELGKKIGASFINQFLAVTFLVVLHPQYVNASPLYAAPLFVLSAIISSMTWWQQAEKNAPTIGLAKSLIPFAFFLATFATLKTNIAIYAAIFFFIHFCLGWFFSKRRDAFLASYTTAGFFAWFLLIPWLGVFPEKVSTIFQKIISGNSDKNILKGLDHLKLSMFDLFSNEHLFWGGNLLDYSAFISLLSIVAIISVFFLWKYRNTPQSALWLLPLISASLATVFFYFVGSTIFPWSFRADYIVRYAIPAMLAGAPLIPYLIQSFNHSGQITALSSGLNLDSPVAPTTQAQSLDSTDKPIFHTINPPQASLKYSPLPSRTWLSLFFQMLTIIIIGLFLALFAHRIAKMALFGSMLSYPNASNQTHIAQVKAMDSKERRAELEMVQNMIPDGAKVLVKISTPLLLNLKRNKVVSMWGNSDFWDRLSSDADINATIKFLKDSGIDYILWQYGERGHVF
jgi:hypothetical protein